MLGAPVMLDAARFGAYAHRCRNFWTNLAVPLHISAAVRKVQRPLGLTVDSILDPGRYSTGVSHTEKQPFYPCNSRHYPRSALPTLVTYTASRAFRHTQGVVQPGCVYDTHAGVWDEPNPDERERALGYATGSTAAPGVTPQQRHIITGNSMDQSALSGLIHCCLKLHQPNRPPPTPTTVPTTLVHNTHATTTPSLPHDTLAKEVAAFLANTYADPLTPPADGSVGGVPGDSDQPEDAATSFMRFKGNKLMARKAREPGEPDIFRDALVLHLLQTGTLADTTTTPAQIRRVKRRAQQYHIATLPDGTKELRRLMANGSTRVVPRAPTRHHP